MAKKTYGGFFISQIKQLSGRVFEKLLKENDIDAFNGAQGRILYVLWQNETLSISEIGRLTSLAKTTLTSMLDRMESSGLVFRTLDKTNRRQILISLTPKARALSTEYDHVSEQMNEVFYHGFTDGEIENFEQYLKRIICNLEKEE